VPISVVIADDDLAISEATVKAHITAILRKLGVNSRTQAVLLAAKLEVDQPVADSAKA
jgi:DNA-binding NarL/FixJ family response regulator